VDGATTMKLCVESAARAPEATKKIISNITGHRPHHFRSYILYSSASSCRVSDSYFMFRKSRVRNFGCKTGYPNRFIALISTVARQTLRQYLKIRNDSLLLSNHSQFSNHSTPFKLRSYAGVTSYPKI